MRICIHWWDQFSFLGNRARYEFIELDMSTGLDMSIPSSRLFRGKKVKMVIEFDDLSSSVTYRARFFKRRNKEKKWKLVQVIAWFVVIFRINNTSDISKLLYVISRAARRVKFETILKYHEWYLCQISSTNSAIICLYYYQPKGCNFHM